MFYSSVSFQKQFANIKKSVFSFAIGIKNKQETSFSSFFLVLACLTLRWCFQLFLFSNLSETFCSSYRASGPGVQTIFYNRTSKKRIYFLLSTTL